MKKISVLLKLWLKEQHLLPRGLTVLFSKSNSLTVPFFVIIQNSLEYLMHKEWLHFPGSYNIDCPCYCTQKVF